MRVLASAYACEPGSGSEPGVGWNWVEQLSRFHEVWVLTRSNNRPHIEAALKHEPLPCVHWEYLDLPVWLRFWKRGPRGARLYYYLWQIAAYLRARGLNRRVRFEVVHHLTFVNYWMPCFLSFLDVPFIWGPVGGGESAPGTLISELGWRAQTYEAARNLARAWARLDPFVRLTARRARRTFCTTEQTLVRVQQLGAREPALYPESGLSARELQSLQKRTRNPHREFRIVSVGRLLHWKGFEFGIRAFARFCQETNADAIYEIVGDGPERRRLLTMAEELGVARKVRWIGRVSRDSALDRLVNADVLLHPSLHDSGGWVCLEAMAAHVPVVCLDLGGPAVQVTENTGIKVKPEGPAQTVRGIADALYRLFADPASRQRYGSHGVQRAGDVFAWDSKGAWMNEVYQSLYVEQ